MNLQSIPFAHNILLFSITLSIYGCGGSSSGTEAVPSTTPLTSSAPHTSNLLTPNTEALSKPDVIATIDGNLLSVRWNNVNADRYRVLYWQANNAPMEINTQALQASANLAQAGTYAILVEAYDEQGSALFSDKAQITFTP